MAEDKSPGFRMKQKQEQKVPGAQIQNKWFAYEANHFGMPMLQARSRRIRLRASIHLLNFNDKVKSEIITEIETGLGFNLMPVFLGIGIMIYFSIPAEPSMIALALTLLALLAIIRKLSLYGMLLHMLLGLSAITIGMLTAQFATHYNQTPVLERQMTAKINALILGIDQNKRGSARYIVKPLNLGDLESNQIPNKLRVSAAAKHDNMRPGDQISGLVRLNPVSGPVHPGGYDFSFFAWHEGLGGSGFFMGRPEKIKPDYTPGLVENFTIYSNRMRIAVEERILNSMPLHTGNIAVALVTGNKTRIPEDVQETLRKTGLAHILAISGLHMALVTLTVIWGIRYVMVFIPTLALRYQIKKWAVCAGFVSATFYLMLSGGGIATQRAWVMISVMLLAVLMDRRAITMRSVAISALIVLLVNPQSIYSPGFQMSFAAVTALVAGYEWINKRRRLKAEEIFIPINQSIIARVSSGFFGYFSGIATTTLIAGTATAFIAAWHFYQVAPLGLVANLIAMPIVSIVIMPFVLFSLLLMPYGLEYIPLTMVSFGVEWVVNASSWVEGVSPNGNTGLLPRYMIVLFAVSLIWLTIFKTRVRVFGFVPLMILPFIIRAPIIPDVIISENGRAAAIRTQNETLGLLYPKGSKFVQTIWLKAWSGGKSEKLNLSKDQCNRERCIVVLPSSKVLHIVYNPEHLQSSCKRADILIAPRLWWVNCRTRSPELVLKRHDFERFGTHALYVKKVRQKANTDNRKLKTKILVQTALPEPTRLWHRVVRHPDNVSDIGE